MINHTEPEDFVVSTMTTHSVREMVDYVFKRLGMDYRDYVTQNPKFMRPEELKYLKVTQQRLEKHWVGNQNIRLKL
jgi:GDPmannose 4,6-dehydratase